MESGLLRRLRAAASAFAAPPMVYGGDRTINHGHVEVELSPAGHVVAVWFMCMLLPFKERVVDAHWAVQRTQMYEHGKPKLVEAVTLFEGLL